MNEETFGSYFRKIRLEAGITQDNVAEYIKRKKMTISLIEREKNEPPKGKLLDLMIESLHITDEDVKDKLYLLASKSRGNVPTDIYDYFFSNEEICNAIRRGLKKTKVMMIGKIYLNKRCSNE